jgi:hypothetical protein
VDHKVGIGPQRRTGILRKLSLPLRCGRIFGQLSTRPFGHPGPFAQYGLVAQFDFARLPNFAHGAYICAWRWHFLVIYRMRDSAGYFVFPASPRHSLARRRPATCRQLALAGWRFSRHGFGKGRWRVVWSSRGEGIDRGGGDRHICASRTPNPLLLSTGI